jgi:hypothetical protein
METALAEQEMLAAGTQGLATSTNSSDDDRLSTPINNESRESLCSESSTPIASVVEMVPLTEEEDLKNVSSSESPLPRPDRPDFEMGDHVYQWCSWAGIPFAYSHHGIVLDVFYNETEQEWSLRVVDFSNWKMDAVVAEDVVEVDNQDFESEGSNQHSPRPPRSLLKKNKTKTLRYDNLNAWTTSSPGGCVRTYESSHCVWHKVQYGTSNFLRQHFSRSGTCTSAESSPPGLVRVRVQFLLDHPEYLPCYSTVQSNSECVAVWCKTGTWATTQAASFLSAFALGQAKSAVTLAGVAASTQVTVPAAGLWGWLGYTTTTSFAAANPMVLPLVAVYGVVTVMAPALWLWRAKDRWEKLTIELNDAFWSKYALEQPEAFAECLSDWSLHDVQT